LAKLIVTPMNYEVLKKFKQLVIAKHGTLGGRLGEALTEAMRLWISREGEAKENKL